MLKITAGGYSLIRPLFDGHIMQSQVDGIERIIKACNDFGLTDIRHAAYVLATIFHETDEAMMPVRENGRGKGYDYGKKLKRTRVPYETPNFIYYGRGDIQLTWYENYQYLGKLAGIDLLNNPDLMLDPPTSAKVALIGMAKGAFTGVKLSTYFNDHKTDPVNARKIINGNDCDEKIAKHYNVFFKALGGVAA